MTEKFGLAVALANRSPSPESEKETTTIAISGPTSSVSLMHGDLQQCLENRLRALTDVNGSLEYELTWKHWAMLSGPPICALRAAGRRISGNACSGWPTPTTIDRIRDEATMRKCLEFRKRNANQNSVPLYLGEVAQMAGWPTPMAGSPATENYNEAGNNDSSRKTVALVDWPSPNAIPESRGGLQANPTKALERRARNHQLNLDDAATLSLASTEKRGVLNPAFSLWLMGFPPEWLNCAPLETQSSRKLRRHS